MPAVDAIVLIGAGNTFVAGADINIFKILKTREQSMARSARHARHAPPARRLGQAARRRHSRQGVRRRTRSWRWPVTTASRSRTPRSDSPKCCSASSPAPAARSGCRGSRASRSALEMCTDGKPVPAPKAKAAGIVDEIVDGDLRAGAIAFAKARAAAGDRRKTREIAISADQAPPGVRRARGRASALAKTARGAQRAACRDRRHRSRRSTRRSTTDRCASASSSPTASSRPNRRRCVTCSSPSARRPRCPTSRRTRRPSTSGAPPSSAPARWAAASR